MSATLPNAKEVRAAAADWLQRRNFWDWSEADQSALDAWLAQSPSHRTAYLRVQAAWESTGRLTALRSIRPVQRPAPKSRRVLPLLMGVAAAVAIAAVVGSSSIEAWFAPQVKTYATKIGGHEILKLADGSRIELNTDTVLRTAITPSERKVWLDRGEAYFQVRHDEKRPFVVLAGNHKVIDLGTKFLMRTGGSKLEVALVEGSARVEAAGPGQTRRAITLKPGDIATARAGGMSVERKTPRELADDLAWRNGMLVFHNAHLADAAAEFNRYGGVKLVVSGSARRLTINGAFPTNGTEDFAGVAHEIFGLHVDRRGNDIVLSH